MSKISLPPLKEAIPLIRKAMEEGRLQAQINTISPPIGKYAGPCAVGVLLKDADQSRLDRGVNSVYGIENLITGGAVKASDSPSQWGKIQFAHDDWLRHPDIGPSRFIATLNLIEGQVNATDPTPAT